MVDWPKRIQKHCGSELHPGEQVEAGTVVEPGGSLGRQLGRQIGLSVGGVVGLLSAEKITKGSETQSSETGVAARFPQAQMILGLSSQRLMAFAQGSMSGKPKEMLASAPLKDIAAMSLEKNKATYTLTVSFADDSEVSYEIVKMGKPAEFVSAFERLSGQ